jgi:hypothetical protein
LLFTVVLTPVATFVIESVAPTTAPCDASEIVPERLPPTTCECAAMEIAIKYVSSRIIR